MVWDLDLIVCYCGSCLRVVLVLCVLLENWFGEVILFFKFKNCYEF